MDSVAFVGTALRPERAAPRRARARAARPWSQAAAAPLLLSALLPKAARRQLRAFRRAAWTGYDLKWGVHKFGGASLNDAELYKTCGDLLISESETQGNAPTAAIVSAAGGMTDALVPPGARYHPKTP